MPLLLIPLLLGAGAVGGYVAGDGVDGASRTVKWVVIAGIVYAAHRGGVLRAVLK